MRYQSVWAVFLFALSLEVFGATHDFSLEDLLSFERISDPQVSPDGKWVAYVRKSMDVEKNTSVSHIWLVPADGGEPRQLTSHEKGEERPRWSPDGKRIAFLSSRTGTPQIWMLPLDGGEARPLTSLSTGADAQVWSRTGKFLAFVSQVYPDAGPGDAAQKKKAEEIEKSPVKARLLDELLYRHWKDWRSGKRNHVFVIPAEGGEARDLTPGDFEAPPFSMGGPDDVSFSADDQEIVFTRGPVREKSAKASDVEAWSTDANLCATPVLGGEIKVLTGENKGWDGSPIFSPNGKFVAYRSQAREGYESDKFRLALFERSTGKVAYLASDLDRSVSEILWEADGSILAGVEDRGRFAIYRVRRRGLAQEGRTELVRDNLNLESLSIPSAGGFLIGQAQSLTQPAEVARMDLGGEPRLLTHVNEAKLKGIRMPLVESISYEGALGAQIQAWLIRPEGIKSGGGGHPFLLTIHGGPQSAWNDAFSYRWNGALLASQGYVVLMVNPHGSTGFGQAFTEQISRDWPGACYQDLMKGVDWAIANGWADPKKLGALGGSFGGYMVNWILGHTNRFQALLSHAGVYNLESMYGSTEELWFPEWELGGPPWKGSRDYENFSPHKAAAQFKTPTLVTHGELDFRVPISEGLQLFTALKRQGVESRFLYFPDEGHWILKPQNSKLWHETVFSWFGAHLKGTATR